MHTQSIARLDALVRDAARRIDPAEARLLLLHTLHRSAAWLFAHGDETAAPEANERFQALVDARASGQPIAYLTGRRSFWDLDLRVTPDTLIPRADTELLVELALARIPAGLAWSVADLGTGSGAVALAIARHRPAAAVVATDASAAALQVARANADDHGIGNVEFRHGSWYVPLAAHRFHLIASNPPYIADCDPHLARGDLRFEPASALASGPEGLDAIREIIFNAAAHLQDGGWLLLEHGWEQGPAVRRLLATARFETVQSARDLEHRERVSMGRIATAA